MRAIVGLTVVALTLLSLWWTTFKSRQIMSRSLGRRLKAGEETSLRSWMEVPEAGLETATTELERNPFQRIVRWFARMGIAKEDDLGNPPTGPVP
jgi:hypothetical protein